jgi:hypothetical protein
MRTHLKHKTKSSPQPKRRIGISPENQVNRFEKQEEQVGKYSGDLAGSDAELYQFLAQYDHGEIKVDFDYLIQTIQTAFENPNINIKNIEQIARILKKEFERKLDDVLNVEDQILSLQDQRGSLANSRFSNEENWKIDLAFMNLESQIKALSDRFGEDGSVGELINTLYSQVERFEERLNSISAAKIELMISILQDEKENNPQADNTIFYLELALEKKKSQTENSIKSGEIISFDSAHQICAELQDFDNKIFKLDQAQILHDLAKKNQEILAKKQAEKKPAESLKIKPPIKKSRITVFQPPAFFTNKEVEARTSKVSAPKALATKAPQPKTESKPAAFQPPKIKSSLPKKPPLRSPLKEMTNVILNAPSRPGIIAPKPIKPVAKTTSQPKTKPTTRPFVVNRPPAFFSPLEAVSGDRALQTRLVIIKSPSANGFNDQNENGQTALMVCLQNDKIKIDDKVKIVGSLLERGAKISANKSPDELVLVAKEQHTTLGEFLEKTLKFERENPKTSPKIKSANSVSPPNFKAHSFSH